MITPRNLLTCFLFFNAFSICYSQESSLELHEIMKGNEFIGQQPSDYVWGPEGKTIYFKWNTSNEHIAPYYSYNLDTKTITQLSPLAETPLPVNGYIEDPSTKRIYFTLGNTLFEWTDGEANPIYTETKRFTLIRSINDHLLIRKDNNIFVLDRTNSSFLQLTNFNKNNAPSNSEELNYLEEQELALFEITRKNKAKEQARKHYNTLNTPQFVKPFYLNGKSLGTIVINDDLDFVVFNTSKYPKNTQTNYLKYITDDGHAAVAKARAKVGASNPEHDVYVWNLKEDTLIEVDFSALSDLNRKPLFFNDYPNNTPDNYQKELIFHIHDLNDKGDRCLIEIKSYDNKDRWIGYIDLKAAIFTELNHQHDEKWIGGPGISGWNSVPGNIGWIDQNNFYFQSEKTGYSHLYVQNCDAKEKPTPLTEGNYEIHSAHLSKDKKKFFITANKTHPGNRDFYHLDLASKKMTPVLTADGNHRVNVSPNEKLLLVNYSYKNKPWDLYYCSNKENAELTAITSSQTKEFTNYKWRAPEIITFQASDKQEVNARIYRPEESTKNNAAVLFVHGAGYLQNAHNWWSGYYREYMFHNLLCDLGYTVLDIDYRASKGYGRDFRTAIYQHMGGKDLSDYVDGRQYLIDKENINPEKIGIYGGSYGGFITIMALLQHPGMFKCGAAIRSVTDWAHYNHAYTSNILNTPETDPKSFERSSPIYFAESLEDQLLMLHGMVDDNVQYQDVVRLSQRFIELGKTNWDLIGYPIEPHGFKETSSWVDEYGRILKLFNEELLSD